MYHPSHVWGMYRASSAKILRDVPLVSRLWDVPEVSQQVEMFGYSFCDHAEPPILST